MSEIQIYGHSDDLIEVVGDTNEELYANYNEDTLIGLSPGIIIQAVYNGEWHFAVEEGVNSMRFNITPVGESEGYNDYTEVVHINTDNEINGVEKL